MRCIHIDLDKLGVGGFLSEFFEDRCNVSARRAPVFYGKSDVERAILSKNSTTQMRKDIMHNKYMPHPILTMKQ
jgi:hypothetical protein